MYGYQPRKQINIEMHGTTLSRPAPLNPSSLRCKFGFHDMVRFGIPSEMATKFVRGCRPYYCTRCSEVEEGRMVPTMPPVKPPKVDGLEEATKLLVDNGYGVYKMPAKASGDETFVYVPQDRAYGPYDKIPSPPKMPEPPEPRIIRETGKPPGDE